MNYIINKFTHSEPIKGLIIGLFVIVGTFPANDWAITTGIDPPLSWVFNYLFENDLTLGKHIIFPHGPLSFFTYPLQDNILLATLITSLFKILLVFNLFRLVDNTNKNISWAISFVISYTFLIVAGFYHLILANIIILYCNYYIHPKNLLKYTAFLVTAFAFYGKSYVAIISIIISFFFIIYYLFRDKNYRKTIIDILFLGGFIILFWVLMYGTFSGIHRYIIGIYHLAQDNSSAVSYYPYNNWFVLSLFILSLISILFINLTKKTAFYVTLIALSFFAAWKHGIAREDIYHVKGFLIYTIICLLIFILFHKKNIYKNLVVSGFAVVFLGLNMQNSVIYSTPQYDIFRANNFIEFVSDFSTLKKKASDETYDNLSSNKLPQDILDIISNSTVDVYPWDYSIIAINNLNWQPRVVIQSYASYTSWLDQRNADHFESEIAPDFLIWELNKTLTGINGGVFNSIDYRYVLNDEPLALVRILCNYDYFFKNNKFQVLKKRDIPTTLIIRDLESKTSKWGEWIAVPGNGNSLLRARLFFSKTLLQRIKSFLYKDEQCWIYLKLKNGSLHKYRIVPKNAEDGIWINPCIINTESLSTVEQILFKCSNQKMMSHNIRIDWQEIDFNDSPDRIPYFFGIDTSINDTTLFSMLNTFEDPGISGWSRVADSLFINGGYSGTHSHLVRAGSFSSTFSIPLDSLPPGNFRITADCWVNAPAYQLSGNISLVLSVDDKNGNIKFKGIPIDDQLIDKHQWNNIFNFTEYKNDRQNKILNAYLYNTSSKDIWVDDFRVMIFK